MKLDDVLQLHVLQLKAITSGHNIGGRLMDQFIDKGEVPELRQMCAKVHPELYADLEQVTGLLSMTKRQFIEAAVSEALERAHELISKHGALGQGEL